jgi:hypothetical protein
VYSVASARPLLKLEEKLASACKPWVLVILSQCSLQSSTGVQAGAIFVNAATRCYLHSTLIGAGLDDDDVEEYRETGVKDFENHAKRTFSDETKEYSIAIARSRYSDPSIRVNRGYMKLPG